MNVDCMNSVRYDKINELETNSMNKSIEVLRRGV
jgi:hypothetical protein